MAALLTMKAPSSSSLPARVFLIGCYIIWVGCLLWCNERDTRWGGIGFGILLALIWLPFDVYRKRHEWLVALPMHVVIALGVSLAIILVAHDKELGSRSDRWADLVYGFLGALSGWIQLQTDKVLERRAEARLRAFLEERSHAPKQKPVMRFAGRQQ